MAATGTTRARENPDGDNALAQILRRTVFFVSACPTRTGFYLQVGGTTDAISPRRTTYGTSVRDDLIQ
jgi:hypothetical protein